MTESSETRNRGAMALLKSSPVQRPGSEPESRMTVAVPAFLAPTGSPYTNDRGVLPLSTHGTILSQQALVSGRYPPHCLRLKPDVSGSVAFLTRLSSPWVHPQTPISLA